jgi:PKD repeat protein
VVGEHNVTAIASNANGSDMQTWIWAVTPSGTLEIIAPSDGFTIEGAFDVTFRITNTGSEEIVFAKGDRSNRINLDITYEDAYFMAHYWSTTTDGFTLAPGESFTKTVKCEVGVYEGDMTITLAHWEEEFDYYVFGPLGMSEISGTIVRSPGTGSPVVGFYGSAALYSGLADYLESFGYLVKYVNRSNFTTVDMVYLDYRSSPLSLPSEGDLLKYVNDGGNLWIYGEAGRSETNFLGATISDSSIYFGGGEDDPSRLWLREHPLTHGVSLITYPWGAWVETGGSIDDIIRIDNHAIQAVDESRKGKILWLIDVDIFGNYWLYDSDNEILAKNIADWLCGVAPVHHEYAIIVAGQADFRQKSAIDHSANNAYRVLRNLGFDNDHIFYLNTESQQIDGQNVVDKPASLDDFNNALDEIKHKIGDSPLILYLVGHGIKEVFDFYTASDPLSSTELREMLEPFQDNLMLIVIGSCYSGSFITLDQITDSISGNNRIIITATHDDEERISILGLGGWYHSSDRFWGNLNNGLNVKDAFIMNAWPGDREHLWLDDNGDNIGHPPDNLGNDGALASATTIGVAGTDDLELTSWYSVWIHSAGELRVYDSQNRVTGLVNGEVEEEIPDSIYDEEDEIVAIFSPSDTYRYEVAGTDEGTYGLEIASIEVAEATTFTAANIPTTVGAIHQYTIDWDALSQGDKGVTVLIDSDGDGVFEQTITTDNTFQLPIASFRYSPENPVVDETITFNASNSYDLDGNITNYEWNLGDGNIKDTPEPIITHSYVLAGEYTVILTVTDDDGATNATAKMITVSSMPDLVITEKLVCWPDNCTICYNVTNIGSRTAPACHNTTLYVDSVEVAHDHVPVDLAPGESYTGCFGGYDWAYTPPSDNITVCADNNESIVELNEDNNCLTNIWMCGDVTGDGRVRTSDGRRIFRHLTFGDPIDTLWAADVTGDGRVRTSDGRRIFRHLTFGDPLNCNCSG